MKKTKIIIVLIGTDADNRPHAARFTESERELATKAAALMGFKVGVAVDVRAIAATKGVPAGRIFAKGRALVPYVKQELYDQLLAAINFETPQLATEAEKSTDGAEILPLSTTPEPWTAIGVGHVVLCEEADGEGWWPAVVDAIGNAGSKLVLHWRDYPNLKKFTRARRSVAISGTELKSKPAK